MKEVKQTVYVCLEHMAANNQESTWLNLTGHEPDQCQHAPVQVLKSEAIQNVYPKEPGNNLQH